MRNRPNRKSFARNVAMTVVALILVALTLAFLLPRLRSSNVSAQASSEKQIGTAVEQQIRALVAEKDSRSSVEQKIDSQLLYAMKMKRGEDIAPGIRQLNVNVDADANGRTEIDITGLVRGTLTEDLIALGCEIVAAYPDYNCVRAIVSLDQLESIAALPQVRFLQPKQEPQYLKHVARSGASRGMPGAQLPPGFLSRAGKVRSFLYEAVTSLLPPDTRDAADGSKTSEGDATHRASTARTMFGANGSGVKIGVISDGTRNLAASQGAGDIPSDVIVLPGYTGTGDEGTAMLEIVHDVAPGAKLYFATANGGSASFAQAIRDLRAAGCDIIVDDIIFIAESPFQDGLAPGVVSNSIANVIWQAVNDVTASGAIYFSSAGNQGNKNDNASGTWQGDFVDGGALALVGEGTVHDFGGSTQFNTATATGSFGSLFWSDALGASSNDYDLFILNSAGTAIVSSSTNVQNGTQDPFESVGTVSSGNRMVVLKKTGAANRFLYLENFRGRLTISTEGNVRGHACATNAFAVAATPAATAFGAVPNPVGPFPNPFNSSSLVELFSSDGPRRLFFSANGAPLTPGNVSSTGGTLRQKPDITAADGVTVTGAGGFASRFFGTSAAAPHAAAIAALLKSANASLTPAQIRSALTNTAIDIEAPGIDRDSGAGIVMAFEALQSIGAVASPNIQSGTITLAEVGGSGNGFVEPGESGTLSIQLLNTGPLAANSVTATLSTTTTGVSITTPNSAYPNLAATSGSGTNATLFGFSLAANVSCPLRVEFVLTVTYAGPGSPKVLPISVKTGPPSLTLTSTLDGVAPVSGPGFTAITGLQNGRLNRLNTISTCGVSKGCPGVTGAGTRRFDAYTFTNCSNTARCIDAQFISSCSSGLFVGAYLGAFNPSDVCTNYLADPGLSPTLLPVDFGFTVPAGATFTVVVSEVNADAGTGCGYTLNLGGLCCQGNVGGCPSVSTLSVPSGSPGTTVTINGSNLNGVTGVRFANGIGAAFSITNNSQLVATIPVSAVTGPIILSKPGCADVVTPNFVVGTGTATSLFIDDGSFELSARVSGSPERYVNRLTPLSYPATLTGVTFFFPQSGPPVGTPITLLVGSNADGDDNIDNTVFQTLVTTIKGTNHFVTYNFPATTINSGDFVVGYQITSTSGQFPAAVDRALPSKRRSYAAIGATSFALLDSFTGNIGGNLGVRARIGSGACPTTSGINPTTDVVGTQVTITGTNFEGISAVKFTNNLSADFDVVNNTTITATVPSGATSGPITISKPTCSDIQTPAFSVAQCPLVSGTNVSAGIVGSQVIISGSNLTGVTAVRFAPNVTATFTVNNNTQLTATVPAGAVTGPITVLRTGCPDAQTGSFTVLGCPTISAINPTVGLVGSSVVINGASLTGVSTVRFSNNVNATFTVNSDSQITASVPTGAVSGPLTLIKTGCPDTQTVSFTVATGVVATVSAASFSPNLPVAAESIVAGFGANMGTELGIGGTLPLPTQLAGTSITVKDSANVERLAGLFFVSTTQANFQIPPGTADGTAFIIVRSGNGAVSIGTVIIVRVAPAVFTANQNGMPGLAAAQIFRFKQDGSSGFEPIGQLSGNQIVPIPIDMGPPTDQVFLVLYGGGIRFRSSLGAVNAQIDGTTVAALYAGDAPGFVGLDQVNLPLSRSLIGRGMITVVVNVDTRTANIVTISVK